MRHQENMSKTLKELREIYDLKDLEFLHVLKDHHVISGDQDLVGSIVARISCNREDLPFVRKGLKEVITGLIVENELNYESPLIFKHTCRNETFIYFFWGHNGPEGGFPQAA